MQSGNMRSGRTAAEPSQRQLRVGEVLRHALANLLERGEARDPQLAGVPITVTEVSISPDLGSATAYVMPLGGSNAEEVLDSLRRAAPFFRRRIGGIVTLKRLPQLSFALDSRFDAADRIAELLRTPSVAADLQPPADEVSEKQAIRQDDP